MYFPVLPFGPFFPDFGPDPDFFEEIGPDLHQKVLSWLKMEKKMINIGLFEHAFNDALDVM